MKSNATGKKFPETDEEWEALIACAPEYTDEEMARKMAEDPDAFPYDPRDAAAVEAFWKDAAVVREGGPKAVREAWAERRRRGQRGPQKAPTKEQITLRLSPEVLAYFRATGPGWQTRIDAALKAFVAERNVSSR